MNKTYLDKFPRNKFNYNPELESKAIRYWTRNEAKEAHGYPFTAWLQLGLLYGCGVYTARE